MHKVPDSVCREKESLRRLADALGGTVESLFGATAESGDLSALNELLLLWTSLRTDESRTEALRAVRSVAEAQPR